MKPPATLLLTRRDVARLLDLDACIAAVEAAFRSRGEGRAPAAGILGIPTGAGGFHVKAAALEEGFSRPYFAAKVNGNFSSNPRRLGLPAIQGIVLLCDAENGCPLAILDSIEITIRRTGAATAVAAKHLARADARVAAICGCGNQGRIQLASLARVRRLERAYASDRDPEAARRFAGEMSNTLGFGVEAVGDFAAAARRADIVVTCTPSREPFLDVSGVSPGTFIAAVGADSPDKQELDPPLLAAARVVADSLEQCAEIGELHHALEAGVMSRSSVYAELQELVSGSKPGRLSSEEITVFDSTGTALQDVAAAALVYEKALAQGPHRSLDFAEVAD
jgi:alanine dehydrogenase